MVREKETERMRENKFSLLFNEFSTVFKSMFGCDISEKGKPGPPKFLHKSYKNTEKNGQNLFFSEL